MNTDNLLRLRNVSRDIFRKCIRPSRFLERNAWVPRSYRNFPGQTPSPRPLPPLRALREEREKNGGSYPNRSSSDPHPGLPEAGEREKPRPRLALRALLHRPADLGEVPDADGFVFATGDQAVPVRREDGRHETPLVSLTGGHLRLVGDGPDMGEPVAADGGDEPAVGRRGDRLDEALVRAPGGPPDLPRRELAERHLALAMRPPGQQRPPGQDRRTQSVAQAHRHRDFVARGRIPQVRASAAAGGDPAAVRGKRQLSDES